MYKMVQFDVYYQGGTPPSKTSFDPRDIRRVEPGSMQWANEGRAVTIITADGDSHYIRGTVGSATKKINAALKGG